VQLFVLLCPRLYIYDKNSTAFSSNSMTTSGEYSLEEYEVQSKYFNTSLYSWLVVVMKTKLRASILERS